jgi:hypothetical protein
MNQLIIDRLAAQSTDDILGVPVLDRSRFAKLIVRECIRLCDEVDLAGADDCIDKIQDHFGVES